VWSKRSPTAPPPEPQRVVTVEDDPALEPGDGDFTLEFRYRNQESYGNIMQKGQSTTRGGQWKVQNPGGKPSCLFKDDAGGQISTQSTVEIKDNVWHTLQCVFTRLNTGESRVDLMIDGVRNSRKVGVVGTIDNASRMSIGGKDVCDQDVITCDYFTGQIDYVKIYKEAPVTPTNQPPDAVMPVPSCTLLDCAFSSAGSFDPDGSIASYAWTFGDGATSTAANPSHTYGAPGTYPVKLVVTDDDGATGSATRNVTVAAGQPPSKPREPEASPGDRSAVVSWLKSGSPGTSQIDRYVVTSEPGNKSCTATTTLTCTVNGLTNGQSYTFTVVAVSAAGTSAPSNPTDAVTPVGKPIGPSTVAGRAGNHRVTVTWSEADGNGSPVTSYVVRQSGGPTQNLPATARSAVFTGLRNGSQYRFTVAAVNARGAGAATSTPEVTPAGKPYRVPNVRVGARNDAVQVSWRAPASSGAKVTRYEIKCSNGKIRSVPGDRRDLRFGGLKSDRTYTFRVRAINRFGAGAWSAPSRRVTTR
jgi:PKD repeat protein